MIKFQKVIEKFGKKGEKTSWTYIIIEARYAKKLNPGVRTSFRVKGKLDNYSFKGVSILPLGDGKFMMPLNASIRKQISKAKGDRLLVVMELDKKEPALSADLLKCLKEEPSALAYFKSLPRSHQNYFSKWIESAKSVATKTKRIVMAVNAMTLQQGFPEMMRASRTIEYWGTTMQSKKE